LAAGTIMRPPVTPFRFMVFAKIAAKIDVESAY